MHYATVLDRLAPTWTLPVGTPRTDYPATAVGNSDPSAPCWIEEDVIRLVGDFLVAEEMAAAFLIGHTFEEGLTVKFQAHASNVWTAPTLDEEIPIPAWYLNGFSCHAWLDLVAALPLAADRTFRYVSVTNVGDANGVSVAIGEIVIVGAFRPLLPDVLIQEGYQLPDENLVSRQQSKRGAQTVYDLGSRERGLSVHAFMDLSGYDAVMDWVDAQHGAARPMVIILDPDSTSRRLSEPRYVRFLEAKIVTSGIKHGAAYEVTLYFEELGQGEMVAAEPVST